MASTDTCEIDAVEIDVEEMNGVWATPEPGDSNEAEEDGVFLFGSPNLWAGKPRWWCSLAPAQSPLALNENAKSVQEPSHTSLYE